MRSLSVLFFALSFSLISCKKDDVSVRITSVSANGSSIELYGDVQIAQRKYHLSEVGVYWFSTSDPDSYKTREALGNDLQFSGTIQVEYDETYSVQPYAIVDDEQYYGEPKTVTTTAEPKPIWNFTAEQPPEVCTHIAVSPSGIIHVFGYSGEQYYSSDEGATWTEVPHINNNPLSEPKFINENVVYVRAFDEIRKSSDGGLSWISIPSPSGFGIGAVFFCSDNTIFCTYSDTIYSSTNSGSTWLAAPVPSTVIGTPYLHSVYFVDENIGYCITQGGELIKTSDGGATWELKTTEPISSQYPNGIWFITENIGYATLGNTVYHTGDGGISWSYKIGASAEVGNLEFCDDFNGVFISHTTGGSKSYWSQDGGTTWGLNGGFLINYISDVAMLSSSKSYAISGVSGLVMVYQ